MDELKCKTCLQWKPSLLLGPENGLCLKRAPIAVSHPRWPVTTAIEYCYDHRRIPVEGTVVLRLKNPNPTEESIAKRNEASKEYIRVNGITRDMVEEGSECQGESIPWGHIQNFVGHLVASKCRKVWCEWNGRLYYTTELIHGGFVPTPALFQHVIEKTDTEGA